MVAVVFPGQGSQKPGMGQALFEVRAEARDVFARVSEATGRDLQEICFRLDEDTLRQTENAQIALYTAGLAAWACLAAHLAGTLTVDAYAGHSIGEYTALAAAGILSVEEGARLVARRGELMAQAGRERPGTMAAIMGLERPELERICAETEGTVVVANDNCPGQLVISGDVASVQAAMAAASAAGAKRAMPLNVSGAFHSPLMADSAVAMAETLKTATFAPGGRVVSNVTAQPVVQVDRWPTLLAQQLEKPVRWTESVQNMVNEGIRTYIECGGGEVLSGLIKRTEREVKTLKVQDLDSLESTVAQIRA